MNTIKVKKYSDVIEEYEAAAGFLPGALLELTSAGKVQAHSTAGGNVGPIMVALENELEGKGITDAYIAGEMVQVWIPYRGDIVLMLLEDAQNVSIGDFVESNGAGYIQAHTVEAVTSADTQTANTIYSDPIVGVMLEAQDLSLLEGSDSSLTTNSKWVKVRIK